MENTKLYYEFARERLRSQETLNVEYDTKVNHTVTLGVAVVSIGALLINLSGNALSGNLWASVPTALFVLSFAAMVGCSVMGRKVVELAQWSVGRTFC